MAKTKIFRVRNGRMQFKCPECQSKKMVAVSPRARRRSIKCHKCNETTNCDLNRRIVRREMQSGKLSMFNVDGKEMEVDLYDISDGGLGVELKVRDSLKISIGQKLKFKCGWNPRLVTSGYYKVCSVKDQRIGVIKLI